MWNFLGRLGAIAARRHGAAAGPSPSGPLSSGFEVSQVDWSEWQDTVRRWNLRHLADGAPAHPGGWPAGAEQPQAGPSRTGRERAPRGIAVTEVDWAAWEDATRGA